MTFLKFKSYAPGFSQNRDNLNDVKNLVNKTDIAIEQVARDCTPTILLKDASSNRKILRRIDNRNYVCIPDKIIDDNSILEIDDSLLAAVGLYIMAGIETARSASYMKMYWNVIDNHENGLIGDDLATNHNIKEDMINGTPEMIVDRDDYDNFLAGDTADLNVKIVGEYNG